MPKNTQTLITETLLSDLQGQRYDSPAKMLCLKNKLAQANMQRDRYRLDMHEMNKKLEQAEFWNQVLVLFIFLLLIAIAVGGIYAHYWN